ncbi:MAG: cyanophycin synthetase [Gammaproteobacteria bacterium]|nr:cyanophycin synthetase [Gammaproteobacteria bacterium]
MNTLPFEDSRRLTGANLFFASTGAVLELAANVADNALLDEWRKRVARARERLGWRHTEAVARLHQAVAEAMAQVSPPVAQVSSPASHRPGASLAISAPCDQLFVATEVNEWALCSALLEHDPVRWRGLEQLLVQTALEDADDRHSVVPPVLEESAAFARLERLAAAERRPALPPLIQAATGRGLQHVLDDDFLTLGAGTGGVDFSLDTLPTAAEVPWGQVHGIPTALVTGSNGKTTTVRLLAACARAHGWHVAYSSTDGVFFDGEVVSAGDYSGPAGGRMAVRDRRAQAAILETARGGILRRGIAVSQTQVALVTNVSSDHFGEYGIFDLDALADVKLSVAAVVAPDGLLVLNADDSLLRAKVGELAARYGRCPPLGWFALDADSPYLKAHRAGRPAPDGGHGGDPGATDGGGHGAGGGHGVGGDVGTTGGGPTCGGRAGRLIAYWAGTEHDLGSIAAMPLTVDGSATYNIANLAGAALAALALGIPHTVIASVFATFGTRPEDNLGRMMRFDVGGVRVVLDYAHNAEGLRGVLRVAQHLREGEGRLGLLLGHAGNRQNADIEELARVAVEFAPDLVVVKENEGHLRGREPGEVPRIIQAALLRAGLPESAVPLRMTEVEAARCALEWARPGDVVALLVHSPTARAEVLLMLGGQRSG